VPDDAFDYVAGPDLAELRVLVAAAGEAVATSLLKAVSGIDGIDELHLVTRRDWATLRVALTVAAGGGAVG
jgi:hypothetical protein